MLTFLKKGVVCGGGVVILPFETLYFLGAFFISSVCGNLGPIILEENDQIRLKIICIPKGERLRKNYWDWLR